MAAVHKFRTRDSQAIGVSTNSFFVSLDRADIIQAAHEAKIETRLEAIKNLIRAYEQKTIQEGELSHDLVSISNQILNLTME